MCLEARTFISRVTDAFKWLGVVPTAHVFSRFEVYGDSSRRLEVNR